MRTPSSLLVVLVAGLLTGCQACERLETPVAFRCERDAGAGQCVGGWRCGLDGFCYDPAKPRVAACEADDDCAPSYRCGTPLAGSGERTSLCRERGVGAAYACAADDDCEGGWRCGLAGACLDTAAESLPPGNGPTSLAPARVSPGFDTNELVAIAVSDRFEVDEGCAPVQAIREVISVVSDAGVVQRLVVPGDFPPGLSIDCDAGVPSQLRPLRAPAKLERFTLDGGPVLALAQLGETTFVLGPNGRLCEIDAAGSTRCEALGFDARSLNVSGTTMLIAWGPSSARLRGAGDAGWSPLLSAENGSGDWLTFNEVSSFSFPSTPSRVLAAATDQGLVQVAIDETGRQADGGWPASTDWQPAGVASLECTGGGEAPLGLRYDRVNDLLVLIKQSRADGTIAAVVLRRDSGAVAGCYSLGTPNLTDTSGFVTGTPMAGSCNPGERLIGASVGRAETGGADTTFELRCARADGGVWARHADSSGASAAGAPLALLAEPHLAPGTLVSRSNPERSVSIAPGGAVWVELGASRRPLFLDRRPLGTWGSTARRIVAETREVAGSTVPGDALLVGGLFEEVAGVGVVLDDTTDARLVAVSRDWPDWAVFSAPFQPPLEQQAVVLISDAGLRLVAGTTPLDQFSAPYVLAPERSGDGGTLVLLSAFDALLAADVTANLARAFDPNRESLADQPVLTVRAVPLPRSPITALLPLPPTPDATGRARLAEGYLLSSGRLFRFEGDNETVWRTRELDAAFGEPFALFAQETRARVAYRSGEIFSLPSRVRLAPVLPSGERVDDVGTHCGVPVAVSAGGLWVLEVLGTEVEGTWRELPLPLPPGRGATLLWLSGALHVVGAGGLVQASGWSCP